MSAEEHPKLSDSAGWAYLRNTSQCLRTHNLRSLLIISISKPRSHFLQFVRAGRSEGLPPADSRSRTGFWAEHFIDNTSTNALLDNDFHLFINRSTELESARRD